MNENSTGLLGSLERAVASLGMADTPSEVFRSLLEGTRAAAPRAFVLLAKGGTWKGWGSVGYAPDVSRRFRALTLGGGDAGACEFGQPSADETTRVVVRIGGKPVAVLVGERTAGESPWQPEALAILSHAARLRLELDLAWRRLRQVTPPEPAVVDGDRSPTPEAIDAAVPSFAEPDTKELEAVETPDAASRGLDDARRFARLVATEIRLYNEEDVVLGRRHGDLSQRLADPLEQGRSTFARRFPAMGNDGLRVLEDAYVQVLAGGDESLLARH